MGHKVAWTESAVSDVEHYASYIAQDSAIYAAKFTSEIRSMAKTLADFPERGRRVPFVDHHQVREIISGNYRLIYQLTEDTVYILAIEHGARLLNIDDLKSKMR